MAEKLSGFHPKPRARDVDQRLASILETVEALREWESTRHTLILNRGRAIDGALAAGATLAEIANLLGVSPERVRQMRQ